VRLRIIIAVLLTVLAATVVCAVGIAGNTLFSVFLLPVWWKKLAHPEPKTPAAPPSAPSALYRARLWWTGLAVARLLPKPMCTVLARMFAAIYWSLAMHRRKVVTANLLPVLNNDRQAADAAWRLFQEFALKVADLWRYESGLAIARVPGEWKGWEIFIAAHARGEGVLLVKPHLGNWELGGTFLAQHGCQLLVVTQPEPEPRLTELRRNSRARRGVETLVVGEDPFGFVEIIKRLQAGATVALLVDRPPPSTAITVELFGQPFQASTAAAELARASGCAIVPAFVVRKSGGYLGEVLPEIHYDRAAIGSRAQRVQLTQEILRAFEPAIRQHVAQWFHFVPIWPRNPVREQIGPI
jgi:lauroyl/myristoyl acyltransferase